MARRPRPKIVSLSDSAAIRVREIMEDRGKGFLRVGVKNGGCAGMEYVQPGDSYWKIAHKYNLSVEALQRANGHGTNRVLRQGEMLIIPKSDKKLP